MRGGVITATGFESCLNSKPKMNFFFLLQKKKKKKLSKLQMGLLILCCFVGTWLSMKHVDIKKTWFDNV